MDNLFDVLSELDNYKRSRNYLKKFYIQERLENSLKNFYLDLNKSFESVIYKNPEKIIKYL